ncbi:expressed unknown protein [Seminavis robusta]|uniref:Endonuclease/exonuclease/phosphatase domain-containing protein n=1 Tax=Seminavis robusta TaxID=568900 RepID=A0A9N8DYP0_9STRA|nr:expressed unknown protein [Seminavis robusta]|eukprot:Sro451_g145790.1 n/a (497) ;mRNA; f:62012-63721
MNLPKDPTHTRIHVQNNSNPNLRKKGTWFSNCYHYKSMEVDLAMGSELGADTTKKAAVHRLHQSAREVFGRDEYRLKASSTPIESATLVKPGGVFIMAIGRIRGAVLEMGEDKFGRWVFAKFRKPGMSPITVISTYQVVKGNPTGASVGETTYKKQLHSCYIRDGRHAPHKLRHHHSRDLIQFVKSCQLQGELVVVGGDLNETWGESPDGMTKLCTVQNCGYQPFKIHILSDHRGLFLDVDTKAFFGSKINTLAPMPIRDLSTKTKLHQIPEYFYMKDKHLLDHRWRNKLPTLRGAMNIHQPNHHLAEDLYNRLVSSSSYGGSRVKTYAPAPYSPELARLRNIHTILKLAVSQFNSQYDLENNIETYRSQLGSIGFTLPATKRECQKKLKQIDKQFKAAVKEEIRTKKLRRAHQQRMIQQHEAKGNSKAAKRIRGMRRAEKVSNVFRKIDNIRNPEKQGGLSYLLVPEDPAEDPKTCQNWKREDAPEGHATQQKPF